MSMLTFKCTMVGVASMHFCMSSRHAISYVPGKRIAPAWRSLWLWLCLREWIPREGAVTFGSMRSFFG